MLHLTSWKSMYVLRESETYTHCICTVFALSSSVYATHLLVIVFRCTGKLLWVWFSLTQHVAEMKALSLSFSNLGNLSRINFNSMDGDINRQSFHGTYLIEDGLPLWVSLVTRVGIFIMVPTSHQQQHSSFNIFIGIPWEGQAWRAKVFFSSLDQIMLFTLLWHGE